MTFEWDEGNLSKQEQVQERSLFIDVAEIETLLDDPYRLSANVT
ncbi:hypothetical protein [Spirosoma flavus]